MSSSYVRTQTKDHLAAELPAENIVDLSGQYGELYDFLALQGVSKRENWIGLQFVGSSDDPVTIAGDDKGCYREIGAILFHIVAPIEIGVDAKILPRVEAVIDAFRGKRINQIIVEGTSPPNFEAGATLEFEGGYTSASTTVSYHRDLNK